MGGGGLEFEGHLGGIRLISSLLSTSLLLPSILLLQASELNCCLSLLLPSILLINSGSSILKLILNTIIFPFDFCYWMKIII